MKNKESPDLDKILQDHESSGSYFSVDGLKTFALDYGKGEAVLCIHGVPTSSFLYRKVLRALEQKGYRGISIDLPGLGLSERPMNFDYSFSNFANFISKGTDVLGLQKYHLVVHDIGGPIGFALAANNKEKVLSLSILNTWIDVVNFEKPLVMRPFEKKVIGEAELKSISHFTWSIIFHKMGVLDGNVISRAEINAYVDLLKREDDGKAFLKIMRNFEDSPEFRDLCYSAVQDVPYPVQAIWGEKDPALTFEKYGNEIKEVANLKEVSLLPSRHFLQEEVWLSISDKIDELVKSTKLGEGQKLK